MFFPSPEHFLSKYDHFLSVRGNIQSGILLQKKKLRLPVNTPRRAELCTYRKMPPAKRGRPSTEIVPRTPERRIDLRTLTVASPKTGQRAPTSMRRATLPAFVSLGNVRQTESGERLDSLYPTLSVYVPQSSADGRQMLNSIAKFGDANYVKPLGQDPEHNLLADRNLLCSGKFFYEAKWITSKEYMAGLPNGAFGCLQWNVLNNEHAELIIAELESLLAAIGACTECPLFNMFDMYKIEFLSRRR